MGARVLRKASSPASPEPRARRGRAATPADVLERLAPGSKLPPGPSELHSLALRAYRAGRELAYEQRGIVLAQLQKELRVFLRVKRGWWDAPGDWVSHDDVLRWARSEQWRVAEVEAVLAHLVLCGEVQRRDGPSVGGLRSSEWCGVSRG